MARTRIMGNQSDMEITMCSPQAISGEAPVAVPNGQLNGTQESWTYNVDSDSSSSSASSPVSNSTNNIPRNRTAPINNLPSLFPTPIRTRTFAQVASQSLQDSNTQELREEKATVSIETTNEGTLSYQNNNANFPPLHEVHPSTLGNKSLMEAMAETTEGDLKTMYSESLEMDDYDDEIVEPKTLQDRIFKLHSSSICDDIFDVKFMIGKDKFEVDSDRLMLSLHCTNLPSVLKCDDKFQLMQPIELPTLSPEGFLGMLQYIYTEKLDMKGKTGGEALVYVSSVLAAAKECGCDDLLKICTSYLERELSVETAARIFSVARANNDVQLKGITLSLIANNPQKVFSSEEFRNLTEDALCELLDTDGWYMNELEVFHAVRRWAEARFSERNTQNVPTGQQLRAAMGRSFDSIRFGLMTKDEIFDGIRNKYADFFEMAERNELLEHHYLNKELSPKFVSRPRGNKINSNSNSCPSTISETQAAPDVSNSTSDVGRSIMSTEMVNEERQLVAHPTRKRVLDGSTIREILAYFVQPPEQQILDTPAAPPKKKRKNKSIAPAAPIPSAYQNHDDTAKEQPLHRFIQRLNDDPVKEITGHIHETVELTSIPTIRVHLPNLKTLHLTLKTRNPFPNGTAFKSTMKLKMQSLKQLIFFDKQPAQTQTNDVLGSLLNLGVNITLKCFQPESTLLKIDHENGILVLNLLKDAQEIINGASNFPLKKLCVSECDLNTLAPIRQDLLEVIVMRKVKGLSNYGDFLKACIALREICWYGLGDEIIILTELLACLPQLKKFSVAKCELVFSKEGATNYLQELYLENCSLDQEYIAQLPALFPYLKRIYIYGEKRPSNLLCSILKMPSIEWIFLWNMSFQYKKGNRRKVCDEELEKAKDFLKSVFGRNYVLQKLLRFILERKLESNEPVPGTSSSALANRPCNQDLFDPTIWKGKKLLGTEKFDIVSKLDFEQNSYEEFYDDYHALHFSEHSKAKALDNANANSNEENGSSSPEAVGVPDLLDISLSP